MNDQFAQLKESVALWDYKQQTYKDIATNVRERRRELGLTQLQLAELMKTKQPDIARLERSTYGALSISRLSRLAFHLKTTVSELTTNPEGGHNINT